MAKIPTALQPPVWLSCILRPLRDTCGCNEVQLLKSLCPFMLKSGGDIRLHKGDQYEVRAGTLEVSHSRRCWDVSPYKGVILNGVQHACFCFDLKGQGDLHLIVINRHVQQSEEQTGNANTKIGQSSHGNCSQRWRGDEEEVKTPGVPYKIAQFCKLLSQENFAKLYLKMPYLFGSSCRFGKC